ncbi:amidohydrolase family protein [Rhizobium sp. 16-449-1b]|uniref:amidohydrolase family protein n=1 Tax=Rhizobium sp. 16-449-1b TaxID=2819989 RepID=UPI001AD96498|nr:amidohydrolase family protein [Rhizobium sp. 16-449-1b]MBO9196958.1 amidohydrolase family protein [Rhizobium sp. 16-449-1b]
MNKDVNSCIVEADIALVGADASGQMQLRHDVAIRIHEGVIAQIGPLRGMLGGNEHLPRYGGKGFIAMPGLVNSHHHFGITPLMAGIPFEPLEFWLPQFRAMRSVGPRLDTLFSAIEMLESGTTTVHHIASGLAGDSDAWHSTADEVIAAYDEIGMRAGYSAMLRDRNVLAYDGDDAVLSDMPPAARDWFAARLYPKGAGVDAYINFHETLRARHAANTRLRVNYAPANLHWCSDGLLEAVASAARSSGSQIHMHLVETKRQADFARQRFGKSAVRYLEGLGLLGSNVTFGHCNWLDEGDAEVLASCGCSVCHNASSGLRLGSGRAEIAKLAKAGVRVALGIDQSNIADDRDMLLEIKLVWALHRGTELFSERVEATEVLRQASENGARTVGFGGLSGRLECGQRADVVLLDRRLVERPFVDARTPISDVVLHRARRDAVRTVLVDGRLVVANGRVTRVDRDDVLERVRVKMSEAPRSADVEAAEMVALAMPAVRKHNSLS